MLISCFHFFLQIVCERSEVYALGCAVARAFPRYSEITTRDDQGVVKVAFVFVGDNVDPLNPQELFCLENSEKGIYVHVKS